MTEHSQITSVTEISPRQPRVAKSFTLPEMLKNVLERLWLIALICALCVTAAVLYNESRTPLFSSRAVINLGLSSGRGQPAYEDYFARLARLKTHIELMRSTPVIRELARDPEVHQLLDIEHHYGISASVSFWQDVRDRLLALIVTHADPSGIPDDPQAYVTEARTVSRLRNAVQATLIGDTELVDLKALDPNPKMAAALVNRLPEAYRKYLLKDRQDETQASLDWMSRELTKLKKGLTTRTLGQIEVMPSSPEGASDVSTPDFLAQEYSSLRDEWEETRKQIRAVEMQLETIERIIASPEKSVPDFVGSALLDQILVSLQNRQAELKGLRATDNASEQKRRATENELGYLTVEFNRQLKQATSPLDAQKSILKTKETTLAGLMQDYKSALETPKIGAKDTDLAGSAAKAGRELYRLILTRMMTADVVSDTPTEEIKLVETGQEAELPLFPDKVRNLSIALLFGLFSGVLLAILSGHLEATVTSEAEIERYFEIPVLGVLPQVRPTPATTNVVM